MEIIEKSDIDKKIEALLAKDVSTHGQIRALAEGYRLWDAELNRVYKKLSAELPGAAKSRLQSSQRAWIVWRDAELKLIDELYGRLEGTMYQPMRMNERMELVRARARALAHYSKSGRE